MVAKSNKQPTVCVIGLGYMGLPTAALFATHGYKVTGYDVDKRKIASLAKGEVYLDEPGLKELVEKSLKAKTLTPSSKIVQSDVYVIAVPTPLHETAQRSELKFVILAAGAIAGVLKKGDLVILESTVPPKTSEKMMIPILESSGLTAGIDFGVSHCPERAIPGNTMHELINNDRVIGALDDASAKKTKKLYESFSHGHIHLTDLTTAETVKLMENTFRDLNIALANEFAKISEQIGISVWEAIHLANHHPRVKILQPGPGVGGHCLAVDPWFLTEDSIDARLIRAAREINDSMPAHVVGHAEQMLDGINHPKVAILGAAYKPNVDDSRESPSTRILELAKKRGWQVGVHDPHVIHYAHDLIPLDDALKGADLMILATHHDAYRDLTPDYVRGLMRACQVLDTRNYIEPEIWRNAGFNVRVLGRGQVGS